MNNKFDIFVKKTENKVKLRLLYATLIIALLVIVKVIFKIDSIIFVPIIVIVFTIIMIITTRKEKKTVVKYGMGMDVDSNIYVPLMLNSEYLAKLSNELSNKIEIPSNIDNLVNYVQCMINNNQMIFVEKKFKLNTIVDLINNMMQMNDIKFKIDINDILNNDNEIIKSRRKDNINTDFYDLAQIRSILEKNQLELIRFFAPNDGFSKLARIDGYILSIIPLSKLEILKKLQIETSKNLNYK